MADPHYPHARDYWVAAAEAERYPVRQGDLVDGIEVDGDAWFAAQIVHPTCDLSKKSVARIQVVRVRPLDDYDASDADKARMVTGAREREGRVEVAYANTFFIAPAAVGGAKFTAPMIADLRAIALVERTGFTRVAALTHEARVYFIRRTLYFRYRLMFPLAQVREWEATRIKSDQRFAGPRPDWAL